MEDLYKPTDKVEGVLIHIVMLYRRIEKEGGNGIKEFLKDNKRNDKNPFGYKFKAETILGIKKAIINHNDDFEIHIK